MRCNNDALLFYTPGIPVDLGVELMVPPFPALLANATRKESGYKTPLTFTVLLNQPVQQRANGLLHEMIALLIAQEACIA